MEQHVLDLSHALPSKVFGPENKGYIESLNKYFSAQERQIRPACFIRPQNTADVALIVSYLSRVNELHGIGSVKFAICSGGHGCFAGSANISDGITIDLQGLNSIEIDEDSLQVSIGTGASWGEVYRTLDPFALAVPGGRHSQVGVGGLTLGGKIILLRLAAELGQVDGIVDSSYRRLKKSGGLSHFSGHVGLVCDNVLEYEVVLASGSTVHIRENDPEHSDLFRALRGGSNNFGVITCFVFRAFRQGRLCGGNLMHPIDTRYQQLQTFYNFACGASYDPSASLIHSFGMSAESGSGFVNGIVYTKPECNPAVIRPFLKLEPIYLNTFRELSLTELTREQDSFNENGIHQIMIATTYYLNLPLLHHTYDLWQASYDSVRDYTGIIWSISLQPITPTIIRRSPFLQDIFRTTPVENAKPVIIAQLTGSWKHSQDTTAIENAAQKLVGDIDLAARAADLQTEYLYLNYAHAGQNVFGEGERRLWLRQVSKKYDPSGIFQRCVPGGFKLF